MPKRRVPLHASSVCVVAACALLTGCYSTATERERLGSGYAPDRARAVVRLAEAGDAGAVHQLVSLLEDPDNAVRMYTILALERLTGQTYDYHYYDSEPRRREAVDRWRAALRDGRVVHKLPSDSDSSAAGRTP